MQSYVFKIFVIFESKFFIHIYTYLRLYSRGLFRGDQLVSGLIGASICELLQCKSCDKPIQTHPEK